MTGVFSIIQENWLTIKTSKIEIAFSNIQKLVHVIKHSFVSTGYIIVSKILKLEPPRTKKTHCSIVNFSEILCQIYHMFCRENGSSILLTEERK